MAHYHIPPREASTHMTHRPHAQAIPSTLSAGSLQLLPGSRKLPHGSTATLLRSGSSNSALFENGTHLQLPGLLHYPYFGACPKKLLGSYVGDGDSTSSGGMSFSTSSSAQHLGVVTSSTPLTSAMATKTSLLRQSSSASSAMYKILEQTAISPRSNHQRAPQSSRATLVQFGASRYPSQAVTVAESGTVAAVKCHELPLIGVGSKRPRSLAEAAELVVRDMQNACQVQGGLDGARTSLGNAHGVNAGNNPEANTAVGFVDYVCNAVDGASVQAEENSRPSPVLPRKRAALVRAAHSLLQQMSLELESAKEEESEEGGATKALNSTTKAGVCTWGEEDMLCSRRKRLKGAALLLLQELESRASRCNSDSADVVAKQKEPAVEVSDELSAQMALLSQESCHFANFPIVKKLTGNDRMAGECDRGNSKRSTSKDSVRALPQRLLQSPSGMSKEIPRETQRNNATCEQQEVGGQEKLCDCHAAKDGAKMTNGTTCTATCTSSCVSRTERQWPVLFGTTLVPADA